MDRSHSGYKAKTSTFFFFTTQKAQSEVEAQPEFYFHTKCDLETSK